MVLPEWLAAILTIIGEIYRIWELPFNIVAIVLGAIIVRKVLQAIIRRSVLQIVSRVKRREGVDDTMSLDASPVAAMRVVQRTRTLGSVLNNVVTTGVVIIAVVLLMAAIAPNATGAFSLITAALGAGLGFGAQNLVKDVLNGMFLVVEDQIGVGDVVDLGPATGVVEEVGIRVTTLRDVNGTQWFVRNGEIIRVGNMSQEWSRVIIDLAVPYDADVELVQERMLATAVDLAENSKWRSRVLEKPEIWGIESISAEAIVIRLVVKTRSNSKDDVARELRSRLKHTLDEMGVHLPALNSIVLSGYEGANSVRGARPPRTRPTPLPAPAASKNTAPRAPRKAAKPDSSGSSDESQGSSGDE